MKVNIIGLDIDDDGRKKIKESAYGEKGLATRTQIRELAKNAVLVEFEKHGVTVSFPVTEEDK